MKAFMKCWGLVLALGAVACVDPKDKPDLVHDFRVLGLSTERPELYAPICELTDEAIDSLRSEVTFRALMVDPNGQGRPIQYTLWACADADDTTCSDTANRVKLAEGSTNEGELSLAIHPGDTTAEDGTPLLVRVKEKDPYQGLGGVRMPLVLHAKAGNEEVYAQKLMVFWCPLVEGMKPNVNPTLPGLRLEGESWSASGVPEIRGKGPFVLQAEDVSALQEEYIVPGLREYQQAVHLKESWIIAWYATFGEFSPQVTGGTDFGGQAGRHRTEWEPPEELGEARDVVFWAVVRDGRGGQSWVSRRLHWSP
ncbi:hypothetical protein DRW03_10680 [Corallococcus sp. H22C18031201]|uniref:hypothetical protein n=1 Tax=Citreicoccus inhibens TaxID=2849499 RepID=UPI000E764EEF|nr:hypothetical protein [Citreicoccus inhibens]MBU8898878.1 hypothetical protein [Citreicoccus inhibens]RJS24066.1 hypothetical protein DRW03_10680 [Corallococcus sp. H22C18031201]